MCVGTGSTAIGIGDGYAIGIRGYAAQVLGSGSARPCISIRGGSSCWAHGD